MLYQKIQRRLWNLAWKFSKDRKNLPTFDFRGVSGHTVGVRGNHRFHQSKQTQPLSCAESLFTRRWQNWIPRVHRQKHQVLFNEAAPQVFRRTSLWKNSSTLNVVAVVTERNEWRPLSYPGPPYPLVTWSAKRHFKTSITGDENERSLERDRRKV